MSILDRVINDIKTAPAVFGRAVNDLNVGGGPVNNAPVPPIVKGSPQNIPVNDAGMPPAATSYGQRLAQIPRGEPLPQHLPLVISQELNRSLLPEPVVRQLGTVASGTPGVHMPSYIAGLHDGAHAYSGMIQPQPTINGQQPFANSGPVIGGMISPGQPTAEPVTPIYPNGQ